ALPLAARLRWVYSASPVRGTARGAPLPALECGRCGLRAPDAWGPHLAASGPNWNCLPCPRLWDGPQGNRAPLAGAHASVPRPGLPRTRANSRSAPDGRGENRVLGVLAWF